MCPKQSLWLSDHIYKLCTRTVMLLSILYFYCMHQKLQPKAWRLIPLLCSAVLYVLSDNSSSEVWGKHFVLSLKLLKLTSSEGGDVMWNEWLLFFSNFTILAWNLISYPVPIKEPPTTPILFNKNDLIDVQKEVFFFSLRLCSGQWAHAMFIRLKVSHCNKRKGEKKMQNTKGKPIVRTGRAFSAGLFITNWDQITVEGTRDRGVEG